jgi:hypothetical protein
MDIQGSWLEKMICSVEPICHDKWTGLYILQEMDMAIKTCPSNLNNTLMIALHVIIDFIDFLLISSYWNVMKKFSPIP